MTIEEAIDLLQTECCVPNSVFQQPKYQAIALGIEALRFRLRLEKAATKSPYRPLPGETKE